MSSVSTKVRNYLIDLLQDDDRVIQKFGAIKEVALPKIVDGILEDIGSSHPKIFREDLELGEDFYEAFNEAIGLLCRTDLGMPPAHVKTHLASVRTIELRREVSAAILSFPLTTDYYLAVMGLTRDSDLAAILLKINFLTQSNSTQRRAYESVVRHKITQDTAKKIRAQIVQDIPSLKTQASQKKSTFTEKPRAIALPGQFCFSTLFQWVKAARSLSEGHPILSNNVKACVIRLACRTQQRKSVLTQDEIDRVVFCYDALIFADQNMLTTPLTSVQKIVSQYINRPELNTLDQELSILRSNFKPANFGKDSRGRTARNIAGKFASLATVDATIALCTISKDTPATFQDTKEVSMAFSYLNIKPKEFHTSEDVALSIKAFCDGDLNPHSGSYVSPWIESPLYIDWTENSDSITRKARKALRSAETLMLLHCAN